MKYSQEYVAEKCGVSRQAVSKWGTNQSEPSMKNLIELAELFQISLSQLTEHKRLSYSNHQSTCQVFLVWKRGSIFFRPDKNSSLLLTNMSIGTY